MHVNTDLAHYDQAQGRQFLNRLVTATEALPGVRTATLTSVIPLGADSIETGIEVDGYQPGPDERPTVYMNSVGTDYFDTMGIPLFEGREFNDLDQPDAAPVLIVKAAELK